MRDASRRSKISSIDGGVGQLGRNSGSTARLQARRSRSPTIPPRVGPLDPRHPPPDPQANTIDWCLRRSARHHMAFDPDTGAVRAKAAIGFTPPVVVERPAALRNWRPGRAVAPRTNHVVLTPYSPPGFIRQ